MKQTLIILVLLFSSSVVAKDYIKNRFEIEGMTLGDSLLDYFTENEIINGENQSYPDKIFTTLITNTDSTIYDIVAVEYKSKDKKYIIQGIQGVIKFDNNIENCYKKQDEIQKNITLLFPKSKKKNWGILKLTIEAEGSTYKPITFDLSSGEVVSVECYYYSVKSFIDHLKITLNSIELKEYLYTEAIKAN